MATTRQNIDTLKRLIKVELEDCNYELWPNVCQIRNTDQGYARIEELIIRLVASEGMPIGSAIALIEQELTHQDQS